MKVACFLSYCFFFRYDDPDPNLEDFKRPCKHNGPSYYCSLVTSRDIKYNKQNIYKTTNKSEQEIKLCHLISACNVQRKRSTKAMPKKRLISVIYHLKSPATKKMVRVCQKFFMQSFNLTIRRINRVANIIHDGGVPKEKRGGDKKSVKSSNKKESIRNFIGNLRGKESHYNRAKSQRIYLGADLSIRKLHKLYNLKSGEAFKSSLSMFSRIFRKEFNIGFSSPASDCCGTCMRLKYQIKLEKDKAKKNLLCCNLECIKGEQKPFMNYVKKILILQRHFALICSKCSLSHELPYQMRSIRIKLAIIYFAA